MYEELINCSNILERERELKHEIKQERNPRARKHLHKELKMLQRVKIPKLHLIK